jgi:hypothetical protein
VFSFLLSGDLDTDEMNLFQYRGAADGKGSSHRKKNCKFFEKHPFFICKLKNDAASVGIILTEAYENKHVDQTYRFCTDDNGGIYNELDGTGRQEGKRPGKNLVYCSRR